ncbi:hypothetical protein GCM10011505_03870 [Tistrella bauzanensis]|uniref:Uncharacterized protein n=1 Tax=Tistrella bauzanensis TaxID=657419 RepID=A0ABQ1I9Z7_9PROT|nr:hypothetical protein GCM10011505_03870 [Tistrella bauzanensis]
MWGRLPCLPGNAGRAGVVGRASDRKKLPVLGAVQELVNRVAIRVRLIGYDICTPGRFRYRADTAGVAALIRMDDVL